MADAHKAEQTVVALFEFSSPVESVVEKLAHAGVPQDAIEIISSLPVHHSHGTGPRCIPLYIITLIAGVVGIGVGLFFAAGTALFYPIHTGGKPLVAPSIVGIISFETMMLLAIVTTFAAMVVRLRSGSRHTTPRDPRINEGAVAISVRMDHEDPRSAVIEGLLKQAGALELRTVGNERSVAQGRQVDEVDAGGKGLWMLLGCLMIFLSSITGCSRDMEEQESYQAQEKPRRHSPTGSIPMNSRAIVTSMPDEPDQRMAHGRRLFTINCAHCHGPNGDGDGPVAGYLRELPKNLHALHVQQQPVAHLFATVTNGKDAMPPFQGEMSAEERWAVAYYVKSLLPAAGRK
jgi:mono/diheme cytochrome c family protein